MSTGKKIAAGAALLLAGREPLSGPRLQFSALSTVPR
jgi:hypothetical protein